MLSSTVDSNSPTVLVVDDEPFNIDVMVGELEDLGLHPVPASNGREALERLDELHCDAMLLDIMMPELDGFGVLEQLRHQGRLAELPVIVVSAVDDMESVSRCIEMGAEDHLTKPFDTSLLRARLGSALEKKQLRDRVARQLEITRSVFGKYVPESVAESILEGRGTLEPSLSVATIMYCDIAGFTGIVENLQPAQAMQMLNEYFTAVLNPIKQHGGVVNQFQGDAMLITFNVPVVDTLHADNALRTANDIQQLVTRERFAGVELKTRIGINTGTIVAGNVGAGDRLHYTVHGDAVNVAAKLEALNKKYGSNTLVSSSTVENLQDNYALECLGNISISGKDSTVLAYRLDTFESP